MAHFLGLGGREECYGELCALPSITSLLPSNSLGSWDHFTLCTQTQSF